MKQIILALILVSLPLSSVTAQISTGKSELRLPVRFEDLTLEVSPPEFEINTETIVIQLASIEYIPEKINYATVVEPYVYQEGSHEFVLTPAEYKWVEGNVDGAATEFEIIPTEFETVTELYVVQPASVEYLDVNTWPAIVKEPIILQDSYLAPDNTIVPAVIEHVPRRIFKTAGPSVERVTPAVTEQLSRRVVKTPAKVIERLVPFEKKNGKTRIIIKAASVQKRDIPPVIKFKNRQIVNNSLPGSEKIIPSITKDFQVKRLAKPQKLILRDKRGNTIREFANFEEFEIYRDTASQASNRSQ
jgi:hypothetical protein